MDIVNFNAVALVVDTIGVVGAVAVIVAYGLLPKYRTHPAPIILLIAICDALMVMSICLLQSARDGSTGSKVHYPVNRVARKPSS